MSLRDLLIKVSVKTDASAVSTLNREVQSTTANVRALEAQLQRVAKAVKESSQTQAFGKMLGLPGARTKNYPAPPTKNPLAGPSIEAFQLPIDTRSGPQKVLDAIKDKVNAVGQSLAKAGEQSQGFASKFLNLQTAFAGFAAVVVGREIVQFIGSVVEGGKALEEMSRRTRVSVESLQGWRALVMKAGIDTGVLETSFRKLSKSSRAATYPSGPRYRSTWRRAA